VAYTLSETGPSTYTASNWSCPGKTLGTDANGKPTVTLALGDNVTCTITNDDKAGTLIVKKVVINDNGGSGKATDFSFSVDGATATAFTQDGDTLHGKNSLTVSAGTYDVTEPAASGYTTTYANCTDVVVANGGSATCTITNDDKAADPSGSTTMSWTISDGAQFSIRPGASNASSATIDFKLFSDAACSKQVGSTDSAGVILNPAGDAASVTSTGFSVGVGTYYWRTFYSGDQYNNPASTACGSEVTTIATP
jgi:hypothetical protein